jgi:hypothetical protein
MKYKPSRLPTILIGLIGGVVLLASSGVHAGNEAYLYSSPSLAANEGQAPEAFQYTVTSYYEDMIDEAKPGALADDHGQHTYENLVVEEKSVDDSLDTSSTQGTGIGMGVTPLFDTYGVIRASSSRDNSTYVALGFITDELMMDDDDTLDSRDEKALSYGFGVNSSSTNFEYMMSMDQDNDGVSAVGMRFISEF